MTEFCYIHPNTSASGYCANCGKPVCTECVDAFAGTIECPQCRGIVSGHSTVQKTDAGSPWSEDMYIGGSSVRIQLFIGLIGTLILIVGNITPLILSWWITSSGIGSSDSINLIIFLVSNISDFVGTIMMLAGYNALRIRYNEVLFFVTIVLGLLFYGSYALVMFMPYSVYTTTVLPIFPIAGLAFPIFVGVSFFRIRNKSFKPNVVGFYGILEVLMFFGTYMLGFLWLVLGSIVFVLPSFLALTLDPIRTYVFYGEWNRKEEPHWITEEKPAL